MESAMSSYTDDEYDQQDEQQPKQNWRRKLEQDAEAGRQAAAERDAVARELAFYKAGIPMTDPRMAYFVKGYDGPLTPDSIKAAAVEAGFVTASPQQQAENAQISAEIDAHQRITDASTGVNTAGKLTQQDVLILAEKAAAGAPDDKKAMAYYAVLQEHGMTKMQMAPQ